MSARKSPRPEKPPPPRPPAPPAIDLDALLRVGDERVHVAADDDDNVRFMAEQIE